MKNKLPKKWLLMIGALCMTTLIVASLAHLNQFKSSFKLLANENEGVVVSDKEQGNADHADIAINEQGDGVIVWQQQTPEWNIYAQRINKAGEKLGPIFKVNQVSGTPQRFPRVAMNKNGDFVVVWQSFFEWGSGVEILGQKFHANGEKWGSEFKVNAIRIVNQILPDVALNDLGSFAVVWSGENFENPDRKYIYYRSFNPEGEPFQKYEIKISAPETRLATNPAVSINAKGQTLVVWQEYIKDTWDIYAQVITNGQKSLKTSLRINNNAALNQIHPDAATKNNDDFLVVWSNETLHMPINMIKRNIVGQILSGSGGKKGGAFNISEGVFNHNNYPSVSSGKNNTLVVWQSFEKGEWKIAGQFLDPSGRPAGDMFTIIKNTHETEPYTDLGWNIYPDVEMDGGGCLGIVWTYFDLEKKQKSIFYKPLDSLSCPSTP